MAPEPLLLTYNLIYRMYNPIEITTYNHDSSILAIMHHYSSPLITIKININHHLYYY